VSRPLDGTRANHMRTCLPSAATTVAVSLLGTLRSIAKRVWRSTSVNVSVVRSGEKVSFLVAWHDAVLDLGRPLADGDTLQSEAGYIDARLLTATATKFSCNAWPDHTLGHQRPICNGRAMSAVPQIATGSLHCGDRRNGPGADKFGRWEGFRLY
jgi:hypothetical protein